MSRPSGNSDSLLRITYSPNVFVPLATACTQNCSYCRFHTAVTQQSVIWPDALLSILDSGQNASCVEVLFTHGQDPDEYDIVRGLLADWGFPDFVSYLIWGCEHALARGLLPHVNPGVIEKDAMTRLRAVVASMGLMLETTAQVTAHRRSPLKASGVRLGMIERAGELGIPFTTGLLIGIGESWPDRIGALHVIRDLERTYGHIQEVILQPVIPQNNAVGLRRPKMATMVRMVQMARRLLPEETVVQVPGNLFTAEQLIELLHAGARDLGGMSPITPDYINPDNHWPPIGVLREDLRRAGMELVTRLPVYQRYLSKKWCTKTVLEIALQNERSICAARS